MNASEFEDKVLRLVNQERAKVGLSPLKMNAKLVTAAGKHSENMAKEDFFAHQDKQGNNIGDRAKKVGYGFSKLGENIAAGQTTPEAVVAAWMNSSGHRRNILNPDYSDIGIGYEYLGNDTGKINYNHYWTQVFGTPLSNNSNSNSSGLGSSPSGSNTRKPSESVSNQNHPSNIGVTRNGSNRNDSLNGTSFNDTLRGFNGRDTLIGYRGNDNLMGGNSSDRLSGGPGFDVLNGGRGSDRMWGGTGGDTFVFDSNDGRIDRIYDFRAKEGDKIRIDASRFGIGKNDYSGFDFSPEKETLSLNGKVFAALNSSDLNDISELNIQLF